ncbi:MAG: hypothetical protein IJH40_11825 [Ruminococcus sp.]|uniref:hypothetical protein n=1 Tax=Ruminococcus sp. TaxID=41978 RepID=UPI00287391BE|nr:hypothetical protein [Ruminococcus sp.]MBQ3286306.1 hypothetical protein [Ruminococcus sp.]
MSDNISREDAINVVVEYDVEQLPDKDGIHQAKAIITKATLCQEENAHSGEVTEMVDLISRDEVLALINKAMFSTANIDMQDYIFNGLRRDVHNLPSADRPTDEPETEPAPVIAYVCDRRRCAICSGEDGGCDHTTDIKHAAHFKNVAGQYMEEEEDNE